jgi:hypothetical protein
MPKNNKKGKLPSTEAATAKADEDLKDMLAEVRAADPTASSSGTCGHGNGNGTSSSTTQTIEIPENTIIAVIKRGDTAQLHRWSRQGVYVTSGEPLVHAVTLGKVDAARCLIKKLGADVNEAGSNGRSPLSMAVANSKIKMARSLVKEFHADVNKIDEAGIAPLHVAVQFGNLAMAKCLVKELGADVNNSGRHGDVTPLFFAVGLGNLDMVRCLKMLGDDVNQRGMKFGRTLLFLAVQLNSLVGLDMIRCLITDVNNADDTGATPLFIAAQNGNLPSVRLLVRELKADINKSRSGITPLMAATAEKHEDVVRWLVKAGADTQISQPVDEFDDTDSGLTAACWSKIVHGASAEQTKYLEAKTHCSSTSCSGAGVKKCTGCKQVRYCGEACQLAHWKAHKADCKRWSAEIKAEVTQQAELTEIAELATSQLGQLK